VEYFLARATAPTGRRLRISPATLRLLESHGWPGNVRELRNVVERAAALCEGTGGVIEPKHLPDTIGAPKVAEIPLAPSAPSHDVRESMKDFERKRLLDALERAGGNQTRAAEMLGLPRRTLSYKLERLGIRVPRRE
jgi:DNA-binding NtrC family response regulator